MNYLTQTSNRKPPVFRSLGCLTCGKGLVLPPWFGQSVQSDHDSKHSDLHSKHLDPQSEDSEQPQKVCSSRAKKHSDIKKHKVWAKYFSQSSSSEEDQFSVHIKRSAKPQRAPSEQDQQQNMSDLPSQYAEEVETFRHILDLPDPRETMPRSSTTVLGLGNQKGQQELRPRSPSAMLPLSPYLKDVRGSCIPWATLACWDTRLR